MSWLPAVLESGGFAGQLLAAPAAAAIGLHRVAAALSCDTRHGGSAGATHCSRRSAGTADTQLSGASHGQPEGSQQQQGLQLHDSLKLPQDTQLTFRHIAQQQHWQQVCLQQLLPFAAGNILSVQPCHSVQPQQLVLCRHASSGHSRSRFVARAAAEADLEQQLLASGLPAAAVRAVMAVAPSWPSLSKETHEIVHRVEQLSDVMGGTAAAGALLTTHPQLLTRPPAALEQQLLNLAAWLRLPLASSPHAGSAGFSGQASSLSSGPSGLALGCQDLMDLVRTSPGVLFLSKQQVAGQLEAMQQLLQLPSLQPLLEEEVAVSQQLLADAHHMQQQQQQDVGSGAAGVAGSVDVLHADHQWLMDEQAQLQEQREQQVQQMTRALKAWRKASQQQQHQQHSAASTAAAAERGVSGFQLPWERWPGRLVCQAPEWLFVDTHAAMPRRVDYLARLLFGSSVITASSSRVSSGMSTGRKVSALLLDAPQLIGVNPSSVPGKVRTLHKVLQQHPGYALQQQHQQRQQQQQLGVEPNSQPDNMLKTQSTKQRKQVKQQQQQQHGADEVAPLLLQSPLLLVPQAKQLEKNGSELLQRLPGLPLYHLLLLLPQPELHWQQLDFLQHLQLLPPASSASLQEASPITVLKPVTAAATQHHTSTNSSSEQQGALLSTAWTDAHLQLLTDALSLQPHSFVGHYPQYPAWQAALAAAQRSSKDWRSGWGWLQELRQDLAGPDCQAWLMQLDGKWQRLLLLAAGQQRLELRPEATSAPAAATVLQPAARRRRQRSSSSRTSSGHGPSSAVGQSSSTARGVSLKQVAAMTGSEFPFMPAAAAGPLPWDLPQLVIQQLLGSSKAALDSELGRLSDVWRQLLAAAAGNEAWQQQLGATAGLLPQALMAAGWKLPAGVSKAITSSSSSSSSSEGGVSSSWREECMQSRAGPGSAAAAALTARQQFWQYLQQPGVLRQLCSRLRYLQQTGLINQQQHAGSSSSSSSSSSSINFGNVWSVLAASDAAFAAACPEHATWQQLNDIVSNKPGWADELAGLQGQQLLHWLQQAAAAWWRLAFLASDAAGDGGIWQAISMSDALAATDGAFTDMFPEARYGSWQALAQLRGEDGSSSSSRSASASSHNQRPFSRDEQAPAKPGSSSSSAAVTRSPQPKADTAAQRLQLLQDYASLHPSWEAELQGWRKETWSTAARTFVPLKARRLEFILQMLEPAGREGVRTAGSAFDEEADTVTSSSSSSSVEEEDAAAAAAAPRVPELVHLVTAANVHFLRRFPLFTAWHEVGSAVQAVPRWSAEWHALRGGALVQLLQQIQQLQAPDPLTFKQQTFEQHAEMLTRKLAHVEQKSGGEDVSSSVDVAGRSSLLRHPSLTRIGVTSCPGSSGSSLATGEDAAVSAASTASGSKKGKGRLAALAAQRISRRQQQQRQLHGHELAVHRLAYFSSGIRAAKAVKDLPLRQLLLMPQEQLLDIAPGLDPALSAAKAQGCADAESSFLEDVYPWLGLKALSPEVHQGLSPKRVRLLEEQADDLLLLQQLAHTWPAWEQQLQRYGPGTLETLLRRMPTRSERLQVMVRAGLQRYDSLKTVLLMAEAMWRSRYPIAQQLAELQAAAAGVTAWERMLCHSPAGAKLVDSIDKLHARRGRLVWLKDEGLTDVPCLRALEWSEAKFAGQYAGYHGDAELAERLGSEVGLGPDDAVGDEDGAREADAADALSGVGSQEEE